MKRFLALVLCLFSVVAIAQSTQIALGGAAASLSGSNAAIKFIVGGPLGGTGTANVLMTNVGAVTATIPTSIFTVAGGTPVTQLATVLSTNTSTGTGTATGSPGSIGGFEGAGVGMTFAATGQYYALTTAGPIPVVPPVLPGLPNFGPIVLPAL
jgi:hypothetical protein